MSVLSYLQAGASGAVLAMKELESIDRSISTLETRINSYFLNSVSQLVFGSYTRGTNLPRRLDQNSDIDYMVVFSDSDCAPQTYLVRLKRFVENRYQTSEVYQSSPTIVLELNHIKFELVPALAKHRGGYRIPDGSSKWQDTDPNDFNSRLVQTNSAHGSLIKPTVRLIKYWNAQNNYVFSSYSLEQWMIGQSYRSCANLKDYLFHAFDNIGTETGAAQWRIDRITRAKKIVQQVRYYEGLGMSGQAEIEIRKLIPE